MNYLTFITKYLACTVELPDSTRQISLFASDQRSLGIRFVDVYSKITSQPTLKVGRGSMRSLRPYFLEPRTPGDHPDRAGNRLVIYYTSKGGRGADAGAGAGRTCGWLRGGGALRLGRPCGLRDPRTSGATRERSASTHSMREQNGKLCMRAKRNGALRRFLTEC
eukprot:5544421-Pleurochrysis_carterae.AAC.1